MAVIKKQFFRITEFIFFHVREDFKDRLKDADLQEIKNWYDGYNWLGQSVYNTFDILLFFSNHNEFRNYWFETGIPSFLINLFTENNYFIPSLEKIEVTESLIGNFDVDLLKLKLCFFKPDI